MPDAHYYEDEMNQAAKGSAMVLLGMIASLGIEFIIRVFVARTLSPSDLGVFTLALKILNLLLLVSVIGLDRGATKSISSAIAMKEEGVAGEIAGSILLVSFVLSVIVASLLFWISDYLEFIFAMTNFASITKILSLTLVPLLLIRLLSAIFGGLKRFLPKLLINDFMLYGSRILLIIAAFLTSASLLNYVAAILISSVASLFVYTLYFFKRSNIKLSFSLRKILALIAIFSPLALEVLMSQLLMSIDVILLGINFTDEIVGFYSAGLSLSQFTLVPVLAIGYVYLPIASQYATKEEKSDLNQLYLALTKWSIVLTLPFTFLFLIFPYTTLSLFGAEYIIASNWFAVLSIGYAIHAFTGLAGSTLVAFERAKVDATIWILGTMAAFLLGIVVIPLGGGLFAAGAVVTGFLIIDSAHLIYLRAAFELELINQNIVKMILWGMIWVILLRLVSIEPNNGLSLLFLPFLFLGVCFLVLIGLFATRSLSAGDLVFLDIISRITGREFVVLRSWLIRIIKE
ncbi:MAG: oligosaccharide flippase family protein [Candidatus Thorarchaeota archaeon]